MSDRPLYLHFLDRELGRSVDFALSPDFAEQIVKCVLLATVSPLYCGLSLLWESQGVDSKRASFLSHLIKSEVLGAVSHHNTVDEFLDRRLRLYRHDAARYPMYFSDAIEYLSAFHPTYYKLDRTTTALAAEIGSWASGQGHAAKNVSDVQLLCSIQKEILLALGQREDRAVTGSLFVPFLRKSDNPEAALKLLQRKVSLEYTHHYVDFGNGDIVTGIPRLGFFDSLARDFPLYDWAILRHVLRRVGLRHLLTAEWQSMHAFWGDISAWRGIGYHAQFRHSLCLFLRASESIVCREEREGAVSPTTYAKRQRILSTFDEYFSVRTGPQAIPSTLSEFFEQASVVCAQLVGDMRRDPKFAGEVDMILEKQKKRACDVLLVTATDIEIDAVYEVAGHQLGRECRLLPLGRGVYVDLGTIGGARTFVAISQKGHSGPGAAYETVRESISALSPSAAIMVGIAFGVDPKAQSIGEVLVSEQVKCYDLQRVGTAPEGGSKIIFRGDLVTASPRLIKCFRAARATWKEAKVSVGVMLSGEKLVDNIDCRDSLRDAAEEAIGGEMEGAGLYAAARYHNTDWIVVKAVSDWADGKKRYNKRKRQRTAALNAMGFVLYALETGLFAPTRSIVGAP